MRSIAGKRDPDATEGLGRPSSVAPRGRRGGRAIAAALTAAALVAGLAACGGSDTSTTATTAAADTTAAAKPAKAASDQEYVWISQNANLPLFVDRVYPALEQASEDLGVKVRKAGPTTVDLAAFISTVEQTCASGVDGVIVVGGWDPALTESVNKCIDQGVPTVVTDGDLPESKRLSYLGTDWYQIGVAQARKQIAEHKEKGKSTGKVATLSIINSDNMRQARQGFADTLKGTGIEVVANEDDKGAADEAAAKAGQLLAAHPDLTGFAAFDSEGGPGIVVALNEAGKNGDVVVTAMEQSPEFFDTLKDGTVSQIIMENYEAMDYWAVQFLYWYNNTDLKVAGLDQAAAAKILPPKVDTGLVEITKENVDAFQQARKASSSAG